MIKYIDLIKPLNKLNCVTKLVCARKMDSSNRILHDIIILEDKPPLDFKRQSIVNNLSIK